MRGRRRRRGVRCGVYTDAPQPPWLKRGRKGTGPASNRDPAASLTTVASFRTRKAHPYVAGRATVRSPPWHDQVPVNKSGKHPDFRVDRTFESSAGNGRISGASWIAAGCERCKVQESGDGRFHVRDRGVELKIGNLIAPEWRSRPAGMCDRPVLDRREQSVSGCASGRGGLWGVPLPYRAVSHRP